MQLIGLFLVFCVSGIQSRRYNMDFSNNVSFTLDTLLASGRYDKRIRPGFGGPPVEIAVNVLIKSMGPVSDDDQSFGLDCYFRQYWYDLRLKHDKLPGLDELSMSWLFIEKVWKPDTYIVNGKKSHLHRITAPNKFMRLRYDGHIEYSMRLTILASCPMYLRKFPLDAQRCPLIVGSYGYTGEDAIYAWAKVSVEKGVELAQFDLVNVTSEEMKYHRRGGLDYSIIQANFWLKRHTGYFLLQVYLPCGLIVLSSWVSFWIDPDDAMARVALGVTTVLSLTTMGFGGRAQLPKVSYWTALDWFVIICFTSVFSVMIEYACVNFIDKMTKDLKKTIEKRQKDEMEAKQNIQELEPPATVRQRSASLSDVKSTSLEVKEEPVRRISIGGEPHPIISKPLKQLRNLPRKLSTIIPAIQDKLTKSMQNLSKMERGFRDPDMTIPRVVISDEDEAPDVALAAEEDDDDVWVDESETEEVEEELPAKRSFQQRFKILYQKWQQWKLLPQESDVLRMMADTEPADKFSKIDIDSRRNFPLAFFIALSIYLIAFAYYLTDDFPERDVELNLYKN